MTLEPVLALQSDPAADQILLCNIWPYPHCSKRLHCCLMHFHCSDPGYQMQGHKDTITYII